MRGHIDGKQISRMLVDGGAIANLMPYLLYKKHWLPIKAGFKPYKQPARRFNPIMYDRIKEEINRLLDAGFIRSCRYADWISNIVPVEKKDSGKIRVYIDMLINEASWHRVISFVDGNAGYNQIYV